jgi:hypothetical protein
MKRVVMRINRRTVLAAVTVTTAVAITAGCAPAYHQLSVSSLKAVAQSGLVNVRAVAWPATGGFGSFCGAPSPLLANASVGSQIVGPGSIGGAVRELYQYSSAAIPSAFVVKLRAAKCSVKTDDASGALRHVSLPGVPAGSVAFATYRSGESDPAEYQVFTAAGPTVLETVVLGGSARDAATEATDTLAAYRAAAWS